MRMEPEEANVLLRDRDVIGEIRPRLDMQENIVTVSKRGNVQTVEVQIRRFVKAIVQRDGQRITSTNAPDRRHVSAVVEHAMELMAVDGVGGRRGGQVDVQPSVATGLHW